MIKALQHNLGIQVAHLQSETSESNATWGAAGALPQIGISISGSAAVSDQRENPTSFIQERLESESMNVGGQLSWTLFDGMGMFAHKRALDVLAEQADGEVDVLVEQTIVAVLIAYDDVLVQRALRDVLQSACAISRERLDWMKLRQESGAAVSFDQLQFENALIADSIGLIQQEVAWNVSMRNLNRLMGEPEDQRWDLTSEMASPKASSDWKSMELQVAQNAQIIQNALLGEALAAATWDQANARLYPVLGLSASYNDQNSQFAAGELSGNGHSANVAGNLTLNFNLFNGGATRRAIQQARIQQSIAALNVENQRQAALEIFRNACDRLEMQDRVFELSSRALRNAEKALAIGVDRLQFGSLSTLDFRDLQLALQRAEVETLRAQQAWGASFAEIQRLLGAYSRFIDTL